MSKGTSSMVARPITSGFHVLRLSQVPKIETDNLQEIASHHGFDQLGDFLANQSIVSTRRAIQSISRKKILELEAKASRSAYKPLHSLASYFRFDARHIDEPSIVPLKLIKFPEIDHAYEEIRVIDPCPNSGLNQYAAEQKYLDASPTGINARWAWNEASVEGAAVRVIDLEQGWLEGHPDLPEFNVLYGSNRDGVGAYVGNHGAAVLGEIAAIDNAIGVIGIAPKVGAINVVSHYDADTDTDGHVADAICAALESDFLQAGDVLLLEIQRNPAKPLPTEIDPLDLDAIRLATAHGIIVVEAAGNGNQSLDDWTTDEGLKVLNPAAEEYLDSGAIMIGAAHSAVSGVPEGHQRYSSSNYGSRVNCYGWGEDVVTTGYSDLNLGEGTIMGYTGDFEETSAASPIVAGVATIVQSKYKADTGMILSPGQMRALLSDPNLGTPQDGGETDPIGVMPDLEKIIGEGLAGVPDIYLRDYVGDTGTIPSDGALSASPDVIVTDQEIADPDAAYGQDSGTANTITLGASVSGGSDHYLHVRMRNRGLAAAAGVTATVYWSDVATLITPGMWTRIGTTAPMDVPADDSLRVSASLLWPESQLPGAGHYCFMALLDSGRDPAPPLPADSDWDGFLALIRDHNNVTWRNFNVIATESLSSSRPLVLDFRVTGAPDRARKFDLQLDQRISGDAELTLEAPESLIEALPAHELDQFEVSKYEAMMRIRLPNREKLVLPSLSINKSASHHCRFILEDGANSFRDDDSISIRQIYSDLVVGQVSWAAHTG